MIKVSALVLDIYDDSAGAIARELPAEYHQCEVASVDEISELPDRCFGLVLKTASGEIRRRYPLHTEDSLKLSEAYFERTRHLLPEEAAQAAEGKFAAAKAGEGYNDVAYVDLQGLEKKASVEEIFPDRYYGLTVGDRSYYPLHDADLVKQAEARFRFTTDGMEPHHRFLYARNIEKRAQALGVELPGDSPVHHYTADQLNPDSLAQAIQQRKQAARGVGTLVLDQLAEAAGCPVRGGELEHPDSVAFRQAKIASRPALPTSQVVATLQQFDKRAGLSLYEYDRGMLDPFAAVFKSAAFPGSNGMIVDGVDLAKITPEVLSSQFEDDFIQEFMANPVQVYKSLPDPVRSVIRSIAGNKMKQSGPQRSEPPVVSSAGEPMQLLAPTYSSGAASVSY